MLSLGKELALLEEKQAGEQCSSQQAMFPTNLQTTRTTAEFQASKVTHLEKTLNS